MAEEVGNDFGRQVEKFFDMQGQPSIMTTQVIIATAQTMSERAR